MTFLLPDPQEDCGQSLPTDRKVLGKINYMAKLKVHVKMALYRYMYSPGWDNSQLQVTPSNCQVALTNCRYSFILQGGYRHCESKVSCPRT